MLIHVMVLDKTLLVSGIGLNQSMLFHSEAVIYERVVDRELPYNSVD